MIQNMKELNEEVLSLYETAKKNPEHARSYLDMGQILDKSIKAANTHLKRCGVNRTKSGGYWDQFISAEKAKVGRPKAA
tara:strand:+ start:6077 stop:6313 length:237 start_codon:yes stop_codon:yes gene_type:complete